MSDFDRRAFARSALQRIPADRTPTQRLNVAAALYTLLQEDGLELWREWCARWEDDDVVVVAATMWRMARVAWKVAVLNLLCEAAGAPLLDTGAETPVQHPDQLFREVDRLEALHAQMLAKLAIDKAQSRSSS